MEEKRDFYKEVEGICVKDNRYKPDVYEFVFQALRFTQSKLQKEGHLTGVELSRGLRDFAIEQYGPLAMTVLNHWGAFKTQDFGSIVFNMIGARLLAKTETDRLDDFVNVYDFKEAFGNVLGDSLMNDKEF